ncbi:MULTISPECIES: metal-sensitive transcriptional regulator [Rhodoglobus]|uniref:DNA-binding FrmR family transcriptional regulator n=2 Tax=Rhodoglobus TaxID=193383 RepID=A0A8H2K6X2_9MICO|nr:metal-sensitive transcriptional regulator [Rhodoglobus vestalii]TQO20315.1 DNA-binding FrmR family transcriptional regulator [Rhodoglobus vestalii]
MTASAAPAEARTGHDPEAMRKVMNRLKRAEGQLRALTESINSESNCKDVVTQLAAVSKALDRAGYLIIANALQSCAINDADGEGSHDGMSSDDIEKLFLSLA